MLKENNKVYSTQLSSMVLIASLTYKVVMLPKYMANTVGGSAFAVMAIMMAIEVLMYCLVYYVIKRINLINEDSRALMIPVMAVIYILTMLKSVIYMSETVTYISSTLFDVGGVTFILISLLPVLAYVVYKGGNTMGRLTQLFFWMIVVSIGANIMFMNVDADINNILPLFPRGGGSVWQACEKYVIWFGDYISLLFLVVEDKRRPKWRKSVFPITLAVVYVAVVAFYVFFTAVYGEVAGQIDFAFSNLAVFTKISSLLGATDFPTVIAWILMAIIKLSLVMYCATMSLTYFIKKKGIALVVNVVIIGVICGVIVATVEEAHALATSWIRYFAMASQYLLPIVLALYVRIRYGKNDKVSRKNMAQAQQKFSKQEEKQGQEKLGQEQTEVKQNA